MELVLTEVCDYLNNYFTDKKYVGTFVIEGGSITLDDLKQGQYFRIIGSTFNDGIHKYPASDLTDEEFIGSVWALAIPETVNALAADIKSWQAINGQADSAALSPFNSESFAGYSYSKGSSGANGGAMSWQDAFAGRLNKYRKLRGARS